jgi:hypothetical protein
MLVRPSVSSSANNRGADGLSLSSSSFVLSHTSSAFRIFPVGVAMLSDREWLLFWVFVGAALGYCITQAIIAGY